MSCNSALVFDIIKQCREIVTSITAEQADSLAAADKKWLLCNREVSTRLQGKLPRYVRSMNDNRFSRSKMRVPKGFAGSPTLRAEYYSIFPICLGR